MVGFMISWHGRALVTLLVMVASAIPVASAAEFLSDPTRPVNANADTGLGTAVAAEPGAGELQSILLVPGRKPRALLGGQWVEQGQLYGDSRVVKISAGSVILQGAAGGKDASRQVLTLTPGIEKTKPVKEQPKRAVEIK